MNQVILDEPRQLREDGHLITTAPVSIGGKRHELRYDVMPPWALAPEACIADGLEPFVAATFVPALSTGLPFEISKPISPRLLGNLERIQEIFHNWYPARFQRIPIVAQAKCVSITRKPSGTASFFSGGIDSFYTLLKHRDEITHLIFVWGFDVRLDDAPLRAKVGDAIREAAAQLGKPLIEVQTPLRSFADSYASWEDSHGAALASVALLFSPFFGKVYIPASAPYSMLEPWGSHPLLDPLWSVEGTEIVHDGCEAYRFEKLSAIAGHEVVQHTLRVCWENPSGEYNCGGCLKCLKAITILRALGAFDRFRTFPRRLDLRAVARYCSSELPSAAYPTMSMRSWQLSLQALERTGRDAALARVLRDCLSRKYERGLPRLVERVARLVERIKGRLARSRRS
ncbi:MAG: hypothetical protein M3007_01320 [Candidatus Eremiobacteraeota bacterium]|nr:hypothetical protein [Candidatus Eremiobacteraeota bacterium]